MTQAQRGNWLVTRFVRVKVGYLEDSRNRECLKHMHVATLLT